MDETNFLLRQRGAPPKPGFDRHNEFKNGSSLNDDKKKGSSDDGRALDGISVYLLLIIFYGFIVFFINFRQNNSFPTPKFIGDPQNSVTDFIEERVRKNLNEFMKLGPRVTGSAANLKAKDLILKTIEEIRVGATEPHQIEVDNQIVDGDFAIDFLVGHLTSVYKNINNIIVNFSRKDNPSNHSVLVNCHYDTFLDSPGGSDDTVSCCVMLEMLRSFSQHTEPFKNNIIFLFNGAEENILQASHGFITKHPWGKTIKAFVNLEATGAGGWEVVFQTGPENPWLIRSYIESVKYPSASVFNQEIFQTGKIPGDTDFRIFRDYGNLAGLDIAHIKNGYVYHTKNDLPRYIQPGSIQRGGENLMNLVETLVSSPQLVNPGPEKHGTMVFFDFIGYFMVSYPMRMAVILNLGISSLFLLTIFRKIVGYNSSEIKGFVYVRELVMAVIFLLLSWTLIIITCVVIALLLTMLGREMSWFTNTLNLIWLYILPSITIVLTLHWILRKTYYKSTNGWQVDGIFYDGNMLLWVMLLVTLTYFKIASAYMVLLWTLFPLLVITRTAKAFKINFKEKPVISVIY
ncbi:endoplasmic reticulum metallopeptidase 1 [Patella vulgata]|uniref:endoplasmic reticulum metallopeptidase 1 n=1 Tax=Patella vulgata TaxID=6465 RepID=UPI00217F3B84|nr:endoplasmic reticulum metallopeptidase 1 [Patella vulgata]